MEEKEDSLKLKKKRYLVNMIISENDNIKTTHTNIQIKEEKLKQENETNIEDCIFKKIF